MPDLIEATAEFTRTFHDNVLQKAMESWKTAHGQEIVRPALRSKTIERKMSEEAAKRNSKKPLGLMPARKKPMTLEDEQGRKDSKINELLSVPVASGYNNIGVVPHTEALGTTRISAKGKGKQRADSVVSPILTLPPSPSTPSQESSQKPIMGQAEVGRR